MLKIVLASIKMILLTNLFIFNRHQKPDVCVFMCYFMYALSKYFMKRWIV